jgi:hypothetical protein
MIIILSPFRSIGSLPSAPIRHELSPAFSQRRRYIHPPSLSGLGHQRFWWVVHGRLALAGHPFGTDICNLGLEIAPSHLPNDRGVSELSPVLIASSRRIRRVRSRQDGAAAVAPKSPRAQISTMTSRGFHLVVPLQRDEAWQSADRGVPDGYPLLCRLAVCYGSRAAATASAIVVMRIGRTSKLTPSGRVASLTALDIAAAAPR